MGADQFSVEGNNATGIQTAITSPIDQTTTPNDGDTLAYDAAFDMWKPVANSAGSVTAVSVTTPVVDTGTATHPNIGLGTGIDATKIADGSVSSTEFQYINSLTSNAQTQLDGKASTTDTRLSPVPSGAGKMPYDTGSAYAEFAAGTTSQVLRGGTTPSFGATPIAAIPTGTSSSTVTIGNDTRLNPTPSGAGKLPYDTGSAYTELAAGTTSQVLVGGTTPAFGSVPFAAIPTGATSTSVTIGNDTRLNPAPSGAGKIPYDTGSGYTAAAAGTSATVLHGGSAPSFSAIAATDISTALAASSYSASSTFSAVNQVTLTGNNGFCVAVQGKYAYVTDLSGAVLSIADVSNPAAPVAIGSVTLAGQLRGLAVQGNYAYVCNNSGNLFYVVDISNPASPSSVGSVAITSPYGLCVSGKYAYIFSENTTSSTIKVIDISVPTAPVIVGSAAADNETCAKLDLKGKYLYSSSSTAQTISVYDISTPTAPTRLNTPLNVAISAIAVEASGRYLYAVDTTNKLVVVDVSNPTALSLVTTLTLTHAGGGICLSGRYAFISDNSNSVCRIVDLQTPGSPTQIVTISTGASTSTLGVCVAGKYAYIAYSSNPDKLGVVDLGGIETGVLKTASIQAGRALITENLNVVGSVAINSGLAVGPSGIYCNGPMTAKALNLGDGAVTQATSVSTGVILNASSGVITTFSQSAAAGAVSTFTVTNNFCLSTSAVMISVGNYAGTYGTNGLPLATVSAVANGSFNVTIVNGATINALSGVLKLNFAIL